ncbi:MAG: HAMP domain-containing sensor histidine kinase [Muricomes sp.]
MKNWYKKPATKGILLLLAHIMVVGAALSIVFLAIFPIHLAKTGFPNFTNKPYEESASFKDMVYAAILNVGEDITLKYNFETEGKYDPNKLVDIVNLAKDGIIDGENESGLAYSLEDLKNWSSEYNEEGTQYQENNIVVCQKPDGTYYYYYWNEFQKKVEDKELILEVENKDNSEFLKELGQGLYTSGYGGNLIIKDREGNTKYTNCWTFDWVLKERYSPAGRANILDAVNNIPELNGKLSKVYGDMEYVLSTISSQTDKYLSQGDMWDEGNTNFTYMFVNENTKKVYTNNGQYKNYDEVKANLERMKSGKSSKYLIVHPKLAEFETNMDISANEGASAMKSYIRSQNGNYIFAASIDTSFPIQDNFYEDKQKYDAYSPYQEKAIFGSIFCNIVFLLILIWLTIIAGRRPNDEECHLNAFDRWKTELGAIFIILLWIFPVIFVTSQWGNVVTGSVSYQVTGYYTMPYTGEYSGSYINSYNVIVAGVVAAYTAACFLIGYLSLVRRIKAKTLWENSLLRGVILFLKEFWEHRSLTVKLVLASVGFVLLNIFVLAVNDGAFVFLMFIFEAIALLYVLIKNVIAGVKLRKGIEEISSGNVDYQIPLTGMKGEKLKTAEMVNNIGNGFQRAVEEGMRSERLKTDLITNVSHDIKTPLTSIINYVDLLKRENFTDPKVQGYLEILEAKAQRLKTLTEDVVEASKVSSGNIVLEMMNVNLVELINQTEGEFAEKFENKNLQMVQNITNEPAIIHVDGRRIWRVLENIYNNAAKYAMPGTRVYADLWVDDKTVNFSLKNISENPLNISADELSERFIRGDISRSSEGSGLGLSIARSLTEMQNGEFKLYLDGDLFKVTIGFPRVK